MPAGAGINATRHFAYNAFGQVLSATDPLGTVTQTSYDGFGNPVSITRDAGAGNLNQTTQMAYSVLGDVVSLTDPRGNVTTSAYDADRRLTQVASPPAPLPLVTPYSYDPDGGLLQTQQSANGTVLSTTSASYTPSGKLATATDADGHVTRYAYDAADRLASTTDAAGRVTTYAYDAMSRRTGTFNPAVQSAALVALGYTPDGRLASLADANSHTTNYAYDGLDRLAVTTFPDASTELLSYDADGNVLSRKTRKGDTIAFTYDTLNRLTSKTAPGEAAVSYGYDLAGHPTSISDTSVAIATPAAGASYMESTSYDALNRPITVAWSPAPAQAIPTASGTTFAYGYDPTNRRITQSATDTSWWSSPATAGTTSYTVNNLNQYSKLASVTPTYDADGNLTYDGVFTYGYDAENRLTSVKRGGTAVASYAYDAQGRRKSKTVGSTTTLFVTDADNREVLEYDGTSGTLERWYAFGQGPDAVLGQMNLAAGTRETMIPDIQGSIIGTLDSGSGTLTKSGYQTYGENPALTTGTYRYTSRRFDPETAGSASQPSGLYYYRARTYSPTWGRFLQPDPIGYAAGTNLYAYVNNDPLNATDPSGRCIEDLCIVEGALLAEGVETVIAAVEATETITTVAEGSVAIAETATTTASAAETSGTITATSGGQTFTISPSGLPVTSAEVGIAEPWAVGSLPADLSDLDIGSASNAAKLVTIAGGSLIVGETILYNESPEDVLQPNEDIGFGLSSPLISNSFPSK